MERVAQQRPGDMPRVEELPDDFDESKVNESLDLSKDQTPSIEELESSYNTRFNKNPNGGTRAPARSFKETLAEFSSTPLFMNEEDVSGTTAEDAEENTALEAIRALQYEGTKAEIARGFKESGNEQVKAKQWKDAREFYDKGLAVLHAKGQADKFEKPQVEDIEETARQWKELEEQIYVNRALCQLEMKNYRSCTLDCAAALRLNPSNVKAYYRSSSALLALQNLLPASDACLRGIKLDPANTALFTLRSKIDSAQKATQAKAAVAKAARDRKGRELLTLKSALDARNVLLRWSEKPPDLQDAGIHLSPDPLSSKSMLVFPLMMLYPMHHQSDFIKAAAEKDQLGDHLSYILPLPWDKGGEYRLGDVELYMETPRGGMVKVGKKVSLLEVVGEGRTVVMDGIVRVHVLPSKLAKGWVEELKRKKAS